MTMFRCPVLLFTPQVLAWIAQFGQTHRVDVLPSGALRWVRQALPVLGGVNDQPALEMQVGDWIASTMARLTGERSAERDRRRQVRAERQAAAAQRAADRAAAAREVDRA